MLMDWTKIGQTLRESALDAHDGELPSVGTAYSFLLDNPECFRSFPQCARCATREADMQTTDGTPLCAECATPDEVVNGSPAWSDWPADMPQKPPIELIAAYHGVPNAPAYIDELRREDPEADAAIAESGGPC